MQNIGAANAGDAFYRYKMPKVAVKVEGRGNGVHTRIVNLADIAKALERPPEYILKFIGYELGACTRSASIVNGEHDAKRIGDIVESFVGSYVCCRSCGNPETTVKVKRGACAPSLKCKACGFLTAVDAARSKMNAYILRNPPPNALKVEEKKVKTAEADRLRDARALAATDDSEIVWMTDASAEAAKRRADEQLTVAAAAMIL